jgi:hypothetical protein
VGLYYDGTEVFTTVSGGVDVAGNLTADNVFVAGGLYHEGDTDTYLYFTTNQILLGTGGSNEVTIDTTGVRLGDSGNGYFQPVSGNYGSIQIDGGAHGGYEGYSIGGRAVFMHDNGTATGIYNDVNNGSGCFMAFMRLVHICTTMGRRGYTQPALGPQ